MHRSRLLNRTLAGVMIPLFFLIGLTIHQTSGLISRLEKNIQSELESAWSYVAHDLGFHLKIIGQQARILALSKEVAAAFGQNQNDVLYHWGRKLIHTGLVSRVSFVNSRGIVLARSHFETRFNDEFPDWDAIKTVRAGRSISHIRQGNGVWYFRVAVPVFQYDVLFLGVVIVEQAISRHFLSQMADGFGLDQILLQGEGDHPGKSLTSRHGLLLISKQMEIMRDSDQRPSFLSVVKDVRLQTGQVRQLKHKLMLSTLLAALMAVTFIYVSTRRYLRPIRIMNICLTQFRDREISLQVLISRLSPLRLNRTELGVIAGSFADTLTQVENSRHELEAKVKERTRELENKTLELKAQIWEHRQADDKFRFLVENTVEGIFLVQNQEILFPNSRAVELFGLTADSPAVPLAGLIHPEDRQRVMDYTGKDLETGMPAQMISFRIVNRDGTRHRVRLYAVSTRWQDQPATLNFMQAVNFF